MEIKLDFLTRNLLNPNQFVILELLRTSTSNKKAQEVLKDLDIPADDYLRLSKDKLIDSIGGKYVITELGKEMLTDGNIFNELLDAYPVKVTRQDGKIAYLKKDRSRARKRYVRITRNRRDIHNHILKCLKFEIEERTKEGTLKWMKLLPNWLQSEEWTVWEERLKEKEFNVIDETETHRPYGTKLI